MGLQGFCLRGISWFYFQSQSSPSALEVQKLIVVIFITKPRSLMPEPRATCFLLLSPAQLFLRPMLTLLSKLRLPCKNDRRGSSLEMVLEVVYLGVMCQRMAPSVFVAFRSLFQGDHLGVEFALRSHEVLLERGGLLIP